MTRADLLRLLLGQARVNGFSLRRWYTGTLGLPWVNAATAIETLASQRRYYALLFSHEFASCFWKTGEVISFSVPSQQFTRVRPDGTTMVVTRKQYVRRSARPDVWRYHLRQMALDQEPLRYMRKFLRVKEDDPLV